MGTAIGIGLIHDLFHPRIGHWTTKVERNPLILNHLGQIAKSIDRGIIRQLMQEGAVELEMIPRAAKLPRGGECKA